MENTHGTIYPAPFCWEIMKAGFRSIKSVHEINEYSMSYVYKLVGVIILIQMCMIIADEFYSPPYS